MGSSGRDTESGGSRGRDIGRDRSDERESGRVIDSGQTLPWGASDFSSALSRAGLCREGTTSVNGSNVSRKGSSASTAKVDHFAKVDHSAKVDDFVGASSSSTRACSSESVVNPKTYTLNPKSQTPNPKP